MSAAIEKIRTQIEAKAGEIDATRDAPRTVDEGLANIMATFDEQAQHSGGHDFLTGVLASDGGERPFGIGPHWPEPLIVQQALLLLIGREHVERQARAILTTSMGDHIGLTRAERSTQLKRLQAELRKLEMDEERAILKAEGEHGFIPRRSEADPKLILEVWSAEL